MSQLLIRYRFWLLHAGNLACGGAVLMIWLAQESPLYVVALLAAIGILLHAASGVQQQGEISPLLTDAAE